LEQKKNELSKSYEVFKGLQEKNKQIEREFQKIKKKIQEKKDLKNDAEKRNGEENLPDGWISFSFFFEVLF
jgi:hypothetical protein